MESLLTMSEAACKANIAYYKAVHAKLTDEALAAYLAEAKWERMLSVIQYTKK